MIDPAVYCFACLIILAAVAYCCVTHALRKMERSMKNQEALSAEQTHRPAPLQLPTS